MGQIGAVAILSLMLSSCIKDHSTDTPQPPVAVLSVLQESPGQQPLDFTLDGVRVNANQLVYGGGLNYFNAYAGKRTAAFTRASGGGVIFSV